MPTRVCPGLSLPRRNASLFPRPALCGWQDFKSNKKTVTFPESQTLLNHRRGHEDMPLCLLYAVMCHAVVRSWYAISVDRPQPDRFADLSLRLVDLVGPQVKCALAQEDQIRRRVTGFCRFGVDAALIDTQLNGVA